MTLDLIRQLVTASGPVRTETAAVQAARRVRKISLEVAACSGVYLTADAAPDGTETRPAVTTRSVPFLQMQDASGTVFAVTQLRRCAIHPALNEAAVAPDLPYGCCDAQHDRQTCDEQCYFHRLSVGACGGKCKRVGCCRCRSGVLGIRFLLLWSRGRSGTVRVRYPAPSGREGKVKYLDWLAVIGFLLAACCFGASWIVWRRSRDIFAVMGFVAGVLYVLMSVISVVRA